MTEGSALPELCLSVVRTLESRMSPDKLRELATALRGEHVCAEEVKILEEVANRAENGWDDPVVRKCLRQMCSFLYLLSAIPEEKRKACEYDG